MIHDPQDTIVALSSAPGPGARAVVRLSGPDALRCALTFFSSREPIAKDQRRWYEGELLLPELASPLPADLHYWPAPRTYTGQDIVELQTISCPPLVDHLIAQLLGAGCRAAQAGEFTMRAFLAGKLDLTQAEAVHGVIEAGDRSELKLALAQLAGGVQQPLQVLRDDLLNLLADVEAGLDFTEEDLQFVERTEILKRIAKGLAQLTLLQKQLTSRFVDNRAFRVVLLGRPNAGKSSLFNAMSPGADALVSPTPGTTRDYLVKRLEIDGTIIELVDTAGWQPATNTIEAQSLELGGRQANEADLILLCVEAGNPLNPREIEYLQHKAHAKTLLVSTKCDLGAAGGDASATSAVTGVGIDELKAALAVQARAKKEPALAPSLSRCRHHVEACLTHLRHAHEAVLNEDPPELLALAIRGALDELGQMVGAIYTDDLLDRIFSRFCIGK